MEFRFLRWMFVAALLATGCKKPGGAAGAAAAGGMAVRVVASIYVAIGAPEISGGMKSAKIERVPQSEQLAWRGVVVLDNPTSMHFRPVGEVVLLDGNGSVLETLPFISLPVLPKREQRFIFPLKTDLSMGEYKLRVRVDIGTNEIQEGSVPFVNAQVLDSQEPAAQNNN